MDQISDDDDIYECLPLEHHDSIRVLTLHSGQTGDLLRGSLQCMRLSDTQCKYSALSYAWENEDPFCYMEINGRRFWLRSNLFVFLTNLRETTQDLCLWTDAICIDQRQQAEKGHQVRLMGRIYSYADRTLAWLGGSMNDAEALLHLREIGPKIREDDLSLSRGPGRASFVEHETFREALLHICRIRYWTRAWILQELILAKSIAICCRNQKLDWEYLCYAYDYNYAVAGDYREELKYNGLSHIFRERYTSQYSNANRGLTQLLRFYFSTSCTIPRDRIFALISLITDTRDPLFNIAVNEIGSAYSTNQIRQIVDYEKASEVLFMEIIHLYSPVDLLKFALPLFQALDLHREVYKLQETFTDPMTGRARLDRVDSSHGQMLYALGDDPRSRTRGPAKLSRADLENVVLLVNCNSGRVKAIKYFLPRTTEYAGAFVNITDVLDLDPNHVDSLVGPIMEAFVDFNTDNITLSIPLMNALIHLIVYCTSLKREIDRSSPQHLRAMASSWWTEDNAISNTNNQRASASRSKVRRFLNSVFNFTTAASRPQVQGSLTDRGRLYRFKQ